jgi:hypothetical protein
MFLSSELVVYPCKPEYSISLVSDPQPSLSSRFSLQFAIAAGVTVIATSSSDEKLKIASKLGAKHVINYKSTPDWDAEVLKIVR